MQWFFTVRENFKLRPIWMNGLMLFCAFMAFIYLPWDIFLKPVAEDQEVWFGYTFTGWAAKLTAIPHWLVYAAGTVGFWKMKRWMFPWASLYVAQIAFAMVAWSLFNERGEPAIEVAMTALPVGIAFLLLAVALWRAKPRFKRMLI